MRPAESRRSLSDPGCLPSFGPTSMSRPCGSRSGNQLFLLPAWIAPLISRRAAGPRATRRRSTRLGSPPCPSSRAASRGRGCLTRRATPLCRARPQARSTLSSSSREQARRLRGKHVRPRPRPEPAAEQTGRLLVLPPRRQAGSRLARPSATRRALRPCARRDRSRGAPRGRGARSSGALDEAPILAGGNRSRRREEARSRR